MTKNKSVKIGIDLPKHVEDYLRKNATALLQAPTQYVLDTFNMIMGFEEGYANDDIEIEVLHALLVHYKEEAEGTKKGILGVIDGGLTAKPKENKLSDMFNGPEPKIEGVIADIRSYMNIPEEESVIKVAGSGTKTLHIIPKVDFILNGKIVLIGHYVPENCISFFHVEFDELERAVFSSVRDDEEFKLISTIWDVLKEADFSDVKPGTILH